MYRILRGALFFVLFLPLTTVPLRAQQSGGLSGLITSGGTPVPGVEVHLETQSCDCRKCSIRCGRCCPAAASTVSDSSGRYSFPELGAGVFKLKVELPGFMSKQLQITVPESGLSQNIDLGAAAVPETITVTRATPMRSQRREGIATGVVVDAKNQRLKNAELLFVNTKKEQCPAALLCSWSDRTDTKGRYRLALPAGTYRLVVAMPNSDVAAALVQVTDKKETASQVMVKPQ